MRAPVCIAAVAFVGCGAAQTCPPVATAAAAEEPTASTPVLRQAPAPSPPDGFVRVTVAGVVPDVQGNALFLVDEQSGRVLPMIIGDAEAHVIELRRLGERFERPLTHDLLDALVESLGGEITMVQVNKLRGGIFIGTVFVWDGDQLRRHDSRSSDAIAIAIGHDVPIYVAGAVLDEAGMTAADIEGLGP